MCEGRMNCRQSISLPPQTAADTRLERSGRAGFHPAVRAPGGVSAGPEETLARFPPPIVPCRNPVTVFVHCGIVIHSQVARGETREDWRVGVCDPPKSWAVRLPCWHLFGLGPLPAPPKPRGRRSAHAPPHPCHQGKGTDGTGRVRLRSSRRKYTATFRNRAGRDTPSQMSRQQFGLPPGSVRVAQE